MFLKAILGLLFVLGLLYILSKILQKYTKIGGVGSTSSIKLDGIMYIDDASKVVSVVHGGMSYLVLVSKNGNVLLDKHEIRG
jgi:hypothetical protein